MLTSVIGFFVSNVNGQYGSSGTEMHTTLMMYQDMAIDP